MDEKDILERIVSEDGNCSAFATGEICKLCPLSKLKKKSNGGYYSCIEALNVYTMPTSEQDKAYKECAKRLLLDLNIEEMLKNDV